MPLGADASLAPRLLGGGEGRGSCGLPSFISRECGGFQGSRDESGKGEGERSALQAERETGLES